MNTALPLTGRDLSPSLLRAIDSAVRRAIDEDIGQGDLTAKLVRIDSGQAQASELKTALEQAGYTPSEPAAPQGATTSSPAGCCGGCRP